MRLKLSSPLLLVVVWFYFHRATRCVGLHLPKWISVSIYTQRESTYYTLHTKNRKINWKCFNKHTHTHINCRQTSSNGTLYFPPFLGQYYRSDVHESVYRCRASNPAGVILSRDIYIRGGNLPHIVSVIQTTTTFAWETCRHVWS